VPLGDTFYSPIFDNDMIWNQIIQTGDPINVLGEAAVQQAVGSPGAVQQMNEITEQVSLETGGDPAQVKGIVQDLALTNSIEGGNTQDLINKIEMEVAEPNDPVSKSLNSLAMQEEQGNYEIVNTAVEKVAEGVSEGNDVEQLVTTAAATTEGAAGGELGAAGTTTTEGEGGGVAPLGEGTAGGEGGGVAPLGEGTAGGEGGGVAPTALDGGTTEDEDEVASEEDDDGDTEEEEEGAVAEEEEEVSDGGDGGDDTEVSADDEGDDSDDGGDDGGDDGDDGGGDDGGDGGGDGGE
jgi:hypothetical protein